jgi:hypothetical protein
MARRESKPFGLDSENCIRSWTTVNYSILWVKFRACPEVLHFRRYKKQIREMFIDLIQWLNDIKPDRNELAVH